MALKLKGSTSGFVAIDAPSVAGNNTLILPENTGSAHQILANDITAGVTTFTQITVSRNGDLTVPGTISIGGTLTYEDVTSVDSVGIVTARGLSIFGNTTGLQVASGISTFQALTGTTGTFSSDVDIADKIVHTGDTNTAIRFPAADTFTVETAGSERIRVDSSGNFGVGTNNPSYKTQISVSDTTAYSASTISANQFQLNISNSGAAGVAGILFVTEPSSGNGGHCGIRALSTGSGSSALTFSTRGSNTSAERLRITSTGRVTIGDLASPDGNLHIHGSSAGSVTAATDANDLVLENSANVGMSFLTANDSLCRIKFADPDATNAGIIIYSHDDDSFRFQHTTNERVRIDSSGRVIIGQTSAYSATGTGNMMLTITKAATSRTDASISNQSSGDNASAAVVLATHGQDYILEATGSGNTTDGPRAFRLLKGSSERLHINTDGNAKFVGIVTATTFVPTVGQLANRNLIINGAMRVAQRGTTYTGGYGGSNNGDYYKTVDRMFVSASNLPSTDVTTSQVTLTSGAPYDDGFRYAFQVRMGYQASTPTNVGVNFVYRMEAQDIACSGWDHKSTSSYITLSFWAKSTVSQTFYGLMRTLDGTQYKYPFSYALTANTWKKVEVTAPGNSNLTLNNDNGEGFRINLAPYLGTDNTANGVTLNTWSTHSNSAKTPDQTATWYQTNGATFEVTGLQLEVGQTATPFEHKKYADELQQCMRYYERQSVNDGNGGYATVAMGHRNSNTRVIIQPNFRVMKRAVAANFEFEGPMRVIYQNNGANQTIDNWTAIQNAQFGLHGGYIVLDRSGGVGGSDGYTFRLEGNGDTSSYIAFDSEL